MDSTFMEYAFGGPSGGMLDRVSGSFVSLRGMPMGWLSPAVILTLEGRKSFVIILTGVSNSAIFALRKIA